MRLICDKHSGLGPLVGPVETRRHVETLDLLTVAEAEAVARAVRSVAVGLRAELDPEFVFSAVVGRAVAHFHQHVFVRHRGTPDELAWHEDWPDAPTGDVAALCARLRTYF
ncbi:histidine triad (HIT) protein [Lentzea flava]|uniref:Histidine triad (HIT) protein n=1 Tax=Lentzea flava TaxID=103732 RepID=A0ABQ2USL0_9PSEU|nr:histidine triad (HIT) protein [Lentzea flava]MCP2201286.1 hypothetical protein [Lentzea flava]GGU49315.1 histidine triad (HIT) protein [Lentzea flava]